MNARHAVVLTLGTLVAGIAGVLVIVDAPGFSDVPRASVEPSPTPERTNTSAPSPTQGATRLAGNSLDEQSTEPISRVPPTAQVPTMQFGRREVERLSVCVQGDPALNGTELATILQGASGLRWWHDEAQAAIVAAEAAEDDSGHASDGQSVPGYTPVPFVEPEVVAGCPGGPALAPDDTNQGVAVRSEPVTNASPHQVHVYLLDDAEADATTSMGADGFRRAMYEKACLSEHECAEATVAMFVRRSAITSPSFVAEMLAHATGLYRAVSPDYPDGHPPSEDGE
jgi:hypothetical protein